MNSTFEINRIGRKMLSSYFENYTLEQLNKIPEKFSNSLFWNIAHCVVTQQLLVYKMSGLPMKVSDEMVAKYRKGTKPEQDATQAEADAIKSLLFSTADQLEADYDNGIFKTFEEYTTSTGAVLKDVKTAIEYANFDLGMHLGIMMSIRKFV